MDGLDQTSIISNEDVDSAFEITEYFINQKINLGGILLKDFGCYCDMLDEVCDNCLEQTPEVEKTCLLPRSSSFSLSSKTNVESFILKSTGNIITLTSVSAGNFFYLLLVLHIRYWGRIKSRVANETFTVWITFSSNYIQVICVEKKLHCKRYQILTLN